MKKISTYIYRHKAGFLLGLFALLISVAVDMIYPQITRRVVDDVIIGGNVNKLTSLLITILVLGLLRFIFQYVKEYSFDKMGSRVAADMRKDIFNHIQGLSADFFDKNNTGELMARVKDDIGNIWGATTYVTMLIIEVIVHTSLIIFCMINLDPVLTIIPIIAMICSALLAVIMEKKLDAVYEELSEANAEMNTVAEENLSGVRTVKAFAREKFEILKFKKHNERYYELNVKQSKAFVRYYPYFQLITKLLPLLILLFGGLKYISNELSLGDLSAFVEYSMNIVWPMEMLGWLSNSLSSAIASNKKLKKIYTETASVKNPETPVILDKVAGKIVFDNVSFAKEDKVRILNNISFTLNAGETIGIMGATGAGKSSIIHLLTRMYDTVEGDIYLDDVNIKDLSLHQLRSNISVVMQDVFLFSDTISENIRLGKQATMDYETIRYASKMAQASGFIENMSDQYETVIGERGVGLSGGQKQRISIARAIAKKAPILVMDDSTSALDMETEHEIQKTLNGLKGISKIIVAHRISSVRNAKTILYLEDGRIAEMGTHEELLEKKGLYYETYMAQYGECDIEREAIICP